jgi:Fur family peroxide stress response transcriptional regulator
MDNSSYNLLRDKHIGVTKPRMAIIDYLDKHRIHPTVDMIYKDLVCEIPTLSRTTIYNVAKKLAECGVIQLLTIDEDKIHLDGDMRPHAHFYCNKCGNVYDLDIQNVYLKNRSIKEHKVEQIHLYYKGICNECFNKQ